MHLVDVAAGTELADGGGNVLALAVGAGHLREGADAEQDARMGVAAGEVDGLPKRIGAAEDARYALVTRGRALDIAGITPPAVIANRSTRSC